MNNYKLIIEYCGSKFSGWQRQANAISIQEVIEEAIYKFSNEYVKVFAAGRTDAGVHATNQVANFNLQKFFSAHNILTSINHFVKPHKICIISCTEVDNNFHARFDAKGRHYLYRLLNRKVKSVINEDRVWWVKEPLNIENIKIGASYLIGKHDFTSFRALHCQAKDPVKTLNNITIMMNEDEMKIYLSAPSFLHHMVRNIVGTLCLVGTNKISPYKIKEILEGKDRRLAGPTAPAHGLYFIGVDY